MVGSPTAAAGTPPYPPLRADARDSPVVPRSYSARESPAFTELDSPVQRWILPYRLGDALGRKLCEVIWGLCAGSSAGQVPVVAWPVRSSLSCCLAPVRSGPAAAWSQRNQAPVGCLAPTKLRAVRPTGLHGDCRHDQPCLHTHAPADSPVWNCPPESSAGKPVSYTHLTLPTKA